MNVENPLQHINYSDEVGWKEVIGWTELRKQYDFPYLPPEQFKQIYEVVHGVHALRKGINI